MPRSKVREMLDVEPLQQLLKRKFATSGETWRALRMNRSLIEKVWRGQKPYVFIDTADKVCISLGVHLDEIYPYEENEET